MLDKVHHIAYTVDDIDAYRSFFADTLEMEEVDYRVMPEDEYKAAVYDIGGVYIEVQEPLGHEEMEKFLDEQGNGLNHVAYEVDDIESSLETLENDKGIIRDWDEPVIAPTFPDCKLIDMDEQTSEGIYLQLVEEMN